MGVLTSIGTAAATSYGGLLAAVLMTSKRGNQRANRYLGLLVGLVSLSILVKLANYSGLSYHYPIFARLDAPFGFLYGPLIFFHIGFLLQGGENWSKQRFFKHLLPATLLTFYLIPFFLLSTATEQAIVQRGFLYFKGDQTVYSFLQNLHILFYLCVSFLIIRKVNHEKKHQSQLVWSKLLLGYATFVVFLAFIEVILPNILFGRSLIPAVIGFFFVAAAYQWLVKPEVFTTDFPKSVLKYRKSGLRDAQIEKIKTRILATFEKERPYLNPNLSLKELASQMAVTPNHLSEIINSVPPAAERDFVAAT